MTDRRLPYSRTLAVLRALSWPLRHRPLSWLTPVLDWLTRTPLRFAVTIAVCVATIVFNIIWKVAHG